MPHKINNNFTLYKKALLDSKLSPVANFAALPDPNTVTNYIAEGSVILVRDVNKNYQAQLDPLSLPDLIWVDISIPSTLTGLYITDITWAAAETLTLSSSLIKGNFYKITDRADEGIIVQAVSTNEFSLTSTGLYLVPDFQNVGIYTTTPLAKGFNFGVWISTLEGSANNGDIFFYNGSMFQVINTAAFAGTSPNLNVAAYVALTKSTTKGYIAESHSLMYDFKNDIIVNRSDKRFNSISNDGSLCQWGNDSCTNNTTLGDSVFSIVNNRGSIYGNFVENGARVGCNNTNVGSIWNSYFSGRGYTYTCNGTVPAGILLNHCEVSLDENITFESTASYVGMVCSNNSSSFTANLNMSTMFSAGTLTIPVANNYIGKFTLINNTGQVIDTIVNPPRFRFSVTPSTTTTQSFQHTSISLPPVAGNLVSDSALINTLVGRATASDSIEYEKDSSGILRRYNIIILI
jgi:hypothetical protein